MLETNSDLQGENSSPAFSVKPSKIPQAYKGIQYNFCKNPVCVNYGVEPEPFNKLGVLGLYASLRKFYF